MYAFGSIVAFVSFFKLSNLASLPSIPIFIPATFGILCIAGMINLYQQLTSSPLIAPDSAWSFFETEQGREIGGLFILAFEMALIVVTSMIVKGKSQKGKQQNTSFMLVGLYWIGFALVLVAFYAAIYLQPEMNKRLNVEHCKGSL